MQKYLEQKLGPFATLPKDVCDMLRHGTGCFVAQSISKPCNGSIGSRFRAQVDLESSVSEDTLVTVSYKAAAAKHNDIISGSSIWFVVVLNCRFRSGFGVSGSKVFHHGLFISFAIFRHFCLSFWESAGHQTICLGDLVNRADRV